MIDSEKLRCLLKQQQILANNTQIKAVINRMAL